MRPPSPTQPPPRLLDLFCGAGGCSVGYARAGFDVVGVDNRPQPHYPSSFHENDAVHSLECLLEGDGPQWLHAAPFDVIHASPPCQKFSRMSVCRPGLAQTYPDLITPVRDLLNAIGKPYVIENVPGEPVRRDIELCGCMFGLRSPRGLGVRRARWFETSPLLYALTPPHNHSEPALPVTGHSPGKEWMASHVARFGKAPGIEERRQAMGVEWMNRDEATEAIPPAFTEFIGAQLLAHLEQAA